MKYKFVARLMSLALTLSILAGCTTITSPARSKFLTEKDRVYWFDYAAERRGAFLIPKSSSGSPSSYSICAEPTPDVALKHTSELALSAKLPNTVDAELKTKFANDVVQLAGRTQTILFLREAMYRLCEQGVNGNLQPNEVKELYTKVIDAAVLFSQASVLQEARNAIKLDPKTQQIIENILNPKK